MFNEYDKFVQEQMLNLTRPDTLKYATILEFWRGDEELARRTFEWCVDVINTRMMEAERKLKVYTDEYE